ncbi:MAG: hypothetical protein PHP52_00735 [Bacteroidales bacterium]|nr:hypothetical protein [Bacteroidales bacterium]MDD4217905.1 hypothetical protein [Bacteroidales bacterium]
MKIINHRINTIVELKNIPCENGVEIDVRDFGRNIVLAHDPFVGGELLEDFVKHYNHSTLIINSKSEGIEFKVIELLEKYDIKDFFFLDSSFAIINKFIKIGETRFAVRFSEIESIQNAINLKSKSNWVWVDCFLSNPLNKPSFDALKNANYQICFVSPDLVGRSNEIAQYIKYFKEKEIILDAICVKKENEYLWKI